MGAAFSTDLLLRSEDEMTDFGKRLSTCLQAGDTLLLSGPIGAGKTHLARAIIQERLRRAGLLEDVPSPTFTLVQTYSDGETEIWHADLYRLTDPQELIELGLADAFQSAIVLIEWPDRMGADVPEDALEIEFKPDGDTRTLTLRSSSDKWARILPALRAKA